ncbi:ribosomal large subunit pseudouridine synthase C [Chitinasiproducens palmae]|uniref:Pseudouridine synthase n=2 Tax=Chitinasiproducens palmae TaxID=1770053 RepID=A0A1H2PUS6_9BURK|nr:ribosomal large subunit pseudouridine synthase C [Chitinasiproducens palmae]
MSDPQGVPRVTFIEIDEDAAGQRIDNFLLRLCKGVPKSHIYRVLRSGEVRVNKGRIDATYRLAVGDSVRVPPLRLPSVDERAHAPVPVGAPLPILFEDAHLLAIDKPAGTAVHGGSGVSHGVIEQLRHQRPEARFLELVHRLDRDTSGVLLLAKKRSALVAMHAQLREGQTDKRYLACVAGDWSEPKRVVTAPLHKFLTPEGERRVAVRDDGQRAHTIFRLRERFAGYALVEAELKTGRTHQIRVHLAHLGRPIVGDDKYGDFALNKALARQGAQPGLNRMFLHAARLGFTHPASGEAMHLEAALPLACERFLGQLREVARTPTPAPAPTPTH